MFRDISHYALESSNISFVVWNFLTAACQGLQRHGVWPAVPSQLTQWASRSHVTSFELVTLWVLRQHALTA